MNDIKFYKGESISLVFTAYDKDKNPVNISGYQKEVSLFTPFSTKIVKNVTAVSNNSFSAKVSPDETAAFEQEGNLNIVVKLKKGDEVKIGKSIPFVLLDPDSAGCGDQGRMSVDSGSLKVDMNFDTDIANFDIYFGNEINMLEGQGIEEHLQAYAKNGGSDKTVQDLDNGKANKVDANGNKVLYSPIKLADLPTKDNPEEEGDGGGNEGGGSELETYNINTATILRYSGYVLSDGSTKSDSTGWKYSDYIACEEGYTVKGQLWGFNENPIVSSVTFLDAAKNVLLAYSAPYGVKDAPFDVNTKAPKNTAFVRFCSHSRSFASLVCNFTLGDDGEEGGGEENIGKYVITSDDVTSDPNDSDKSKLITVEALHKYIPEGGNEGGGSELETYNINTSAILNSGGYVLTDGSIKSDNTGWRYSGFIECKEGYTVKGQLIGFGGGPVVSNVTFLDESKNVLLAYNAPSSTSGTAFDVNTKAPKYTAFVRFCSHSKGFDSLTCNFTNGDDSEEGGEAKTLTSDDIATSLEDDANKLITIGLLTSGTAGNRVLYQGTNTFRGALNVLCINLVTRSPKALNILCTPLHRENFASQPNEMKPNSAGLYLEQYAQAIREAGAIHGIPVIDLYSGSGLQPNIAANKSAYFSGSDGLHPNSYGHQRMGEYIASQIKALNCNINWATAIANFVGDSITQGTGTDLLYLNVVKSILGLQTANNYGYSGSTIANRETPMFQRVSSIDANGAINLVFGGTNDFYVSIPLGQWYM